jgi:hypothetical protein
MKFNKWIIALAALLFCAGLTQAQTYTTNVVSVVSTNSNGQVVTTQTETINVIPAPVTNVVVVIATNGVIPPAPAPAITAQSFLTTAWGDLKGATNYAIVPYATYAPKAPTKIGGGALIIYNVNNYVGAGLGVDWLGGFSMVSGNVQLKLPINMGQFIASMTNLTVTPFVLGGIGTPFSGGGGLSTIEDVGAYLQFGHLWGGQFVTGGSYGKWLGTGAYDVPRYHGFFGWKIGF